MIGCTKLLCGTATVSEVIKHGGQEVPPSLLQFSEIRRPLVVWNMTNRCNLRCQHCYIDAEDKHYKEELTTEEARDFIYDLGKMRVPVLLFSGGEPLLRKDLFLLGELAAEQGLRPVISSNGTLIDDEMAKKIRKAGFQYVGISIDGREETHDNFRAQRGSFRAALRGIRACLDNGVKTGIRFTVHKQNMDDLPAILELVEKEGIPRFCMYHLVYSGRGKSMAAMDTSQEEKRSILEFLSRKTVELFNKGVEVEILTTDNHADGIFLFHYIKEKEPKRAEEIVQLLHMHGGCSAGTKFANVDAYGRVHPCQFWQDYTVGNIREKPFSEIWNADDELMVKLREKEKHVKGKCRECAHKSLCGGCRIRAREVYGDIWAEDPACYLTEEERKG
ncbi:radical SAM additional 4Fe4S-binding SPASM domain-containing protein [Thermosyntropha lipolytica DSM 11003]|uniref:Mycofactocin maturase MftC n=1 Tax=Thermosyntropha lipolytica DSM 11003 TaxID=1123382 RepID=A0A1M5NJF5_9FIRM|nr:radical SAM protein [Thermosyntropha lipolytica]SHG89587.1 radical SAM additional 4Fe4S-binding SPASM domain-containing protein [Thermosyntropha lipolytica DSM 11003]